MSELVTPHPGALPARDRTAHERDAVAMRAIASGDRAAFRHVYEAHSARAYRLAYGVLLDRDEAREAVQEAFFRLHQYASRWEPHAAISTWLHRVVLNHCLNVRRKLFRFRKAEALHTQPPSPEIVAVRGRAIAVVEKSLADLPPRERAMLTLYLDEGLRPIEIAGLVNMNANATRVALHRALKRLRDGLRAAGIEDASESVETFADLEEETDVTNT
jgi:RNA polymerase sigma-70 factor, ECF subfamily